MDKILFNRSLWTGHLRLVTLGNSWNIRITQDFTFKIVNVSGYSNFEVCGDSGIMENFGGSYLTAYNEKEGKNKYVRWGCTFVFIVTHGLKLITKRIK
jgi:hypothetical protein